VLPVDIDAIDWLNLKFAYWSVVGDISVVSSNEYTKPPNPTLSSLLPLPVQFTSVGTISTQYLSPSTKLAVVE